MEYTISQEVIESEVDRLKEELKESGTAIIEYPTVGGVNVARALVSVVSHHVDGDIKREHLTGKSSMRLSVVEPEAKPKPAKKSSTKAAKKPAAKKKTTAKKAADDKRVKVTSESEA